MKAGEIAAFLNAEIVGNVDVEIKSVASIDNAGASDLSFLERGDLPKTRAGCVIVPADTAVGADTTIIRSANPKLDFALASALLHPLKERGPEIHHSAIISSTAQIGNSVFIGAFTCIGDDSVIGDGSQLRAGSKVGDNVSLGKNCVLHPNVFVEDDCILGDNVILHTGVVIGTPGFGFVRDTRGEYHQFPQLGAVVIEDNVEIGANSCVDRGALGETRIGEGTKIDNLVQIAHNVKIGKRVVIAAQTGISGSTIIEDDCVIGGQVGMGDHARVQSGAVIGSQAGVLPGKIVRRGVWWGTPIQPLDEYKIQNAHLKAIGRLREEVKRLRDMVEKTSHDAQDEGGKNGPA